jgi:hypothetical protein
MLVLGAYFVFLTGGIHCLFYSSFSEFTLSQSSRLRFGVATTKSVFLCKFLNVKLLQ